MTKRILIVGQPGGRFLKRAQEEGKKYNIEVDGCRASALLSRHDKSETAISVNGKNIFDYDLIHFFTVQENRLMWYAAGAEAAKRGVKIMDQNCVDTLASEWSILHKLAKQAELSLPYPATTIVSSFSQARRELKKVQWPVVIKTLNSRKGRGVGLVKHWHNFLWFYATQRREKSFAIREFIDSDGDYRINVIGGKAYVAVLRRGQGGEWRNNLSLGGVGQNIPLSEIPELVEIAEKAANAFRFDLAGVDIIVSKSGSPYILEINRSPELEAFEELSGVNMIEKVIQLYQRKCE